MASMIQNALSSVMEWLESLSTEQAALGMIVLGMLFTVSTIISTSPLNFAAGALFGPIQGGIIFNIGLTIGSWINFMLGRTCLRDWALRQLQSSPKLSALDKALKKKGAMMVILARLSPVFPFAPIGYALGATSLSTFVFVWATFVGVMPGCILYSWIGASAASAASEGGDIGSYISIAGGVVSTILVSWQAKKSFDEAVAETEEHSK